MPNGHFYICISFLGWNLSQQFLQHFILSSARPHCFFYNFEISKSACKYPPTNYIWTSIFFIWDIILFICKWHWLALVASLASATAPPYSCMNSPVLARSLCRDSPLFRISGVQHTTIPTSNVDMFQMSRLLHCFCMSLA